MTYFSAITTSQIERESETVPMSIHSNNSLQQKLSKLDEQIQRRTLLAILGYAMALGGAVVLYLWFPFSLSRIGSAILIIALAHMIWKVYQASRPAQLPEPAYGHHPMLEQLNKVEAQIRLIQSLIFNLPFLVGANLFFMGLPGTGSAESKALQDCFFLFASIVLFSLCYFTNQLAARRALLPLRQELLAEIPRGRV